jgi:hypothetical protein
LRLFDNDFDWIASASSRTWSGILGDILRPIPEDWGFQHRPVQTLFFKGLQGLFGYNPLPYYAFKSLLFSAVVAAIAVFCRVGGLSNQAAFTAATVFGLSSPVFASVLWVSDFELLAQFFTVATFALVLLARRSNYYDQDKVRSFLYQVALFLLVVLAHRSKGSAKLIPAILFVYLFITNRQALRRHLVVLTLMGLTIVPVFRLVSDPIPPFAPWAADQSQGWMWKPANWETLRVLLLGNAHLIRSIYEGGTAHSLLSVLCPTLFWCGLLAGGIVLSKRGMVCGISHRERATLPLVGIWFVATVFSFSAFPRLPADFMARYVTVALVPASILLGVLLSRAAGALPRRLSPYAAPVLVAVVVGHGLTNSVQVRHTRDFVGQIIVSYDRAREAIAKTVRDSDIYLLDFTYGYSRAIDDGNRYIQNTGRAVQMDNNRSFYVLVYHEVRTPRVDFAVPAQRIARALPNVLRGTTGGRVRLQPVGDYHGLTDGLCDRWINRDSRAAHAILFRVGFDPIESQEG